MTKDENWVAEQSRLIDLEDGFGPGYVPLTSGDEVTDRTEAASRR